MTTPTPSPRPAALVIAETVRRLCGPIGATDVADAIIRSLAASDAVLIPRAELEEAAEALDRNGGRVPSLDTLEKIANRLRQRSRG